MNGEYSPPKSQIHQWIYVIVPVNNKAGYLLSYDQSQMTAASQDSLYFAAFCKGCRTYFTEEVPMSLDGTALFSDSKLPRYGCEPISEEVTTNPASAQFDM